MSIEDVAVIIPVKNEENKLLECISSIMDGNNKKIKIYIVDDNSTDKTVENAKTYLEKKGYSGTVIVNDGSRAIGAGACRNIGFESIEGNPTYVMFFDADDTMPKGSIDELVNAAELNESDIVVGAYEYITHESHYSSIGMTGQDRYIWNKIMPNKKMLSFRIDNHGEFLETVNYPWNKLIKYSYAKNIGLHFSETIVHNDIFAHWLILLNSEKVTLLNKSVCNHVVIENNSQITNISDERRLAMFTVLNEVEELILNNPYFYANYYKFFLRFKIRLIKWAENRIQEELKRKFIHSAQMSFEQTSLRMLTVVSDSFPAVAADAMYYKIGLK